MLSKKDYKVIAQAIADSTDTQGQIDKDLLMENLSDYFGEDNPNFDSDKFRQACNA